MSDSYQYEEYMRGIVGFLQTPLQDSQTPRRVSAKAEYYAPGTQTVGAITVQPQEPPKTLPAHNTGYAQETPLQQVSLSSAQPPSRMSTTVPLVMLVALAYLFYMRR